jgi:hypothetical protein
MAIHRPGNIRVSFRVFDPPDFRPGQRIIGGRTISACADDLIVISGTNYEWCGICLRHRLTTRRFPADLACVLVERHNISIFITVTIDDQQVSIQGG